LQVVCIVLLLTVFVPELRFGVVVVVGGYVVVGDCGHFGDCWWWLGWI
jgi:hypothetical protein